MIRIGLLGTQSFHALAFTKLCNVPDENGKYLFDDVRITAVCGDDDTKEHLETVMAEGNVDTCVETKEELAEIVDAVMILYRKGSAHLDCAVYFLERKIPVWLDKPLCSSVEDIEKLKIAVEKSGTLFSGGSTLRYDSKALEAREYIKSGVLGHISGGVVNHSGDIESPYDGLYFYAPHAVQFLLDFFGYNPKTVTTTALSNDVLSAAVKYDDKLVNVNINARARIPYVMVYGDADCYVQSFAGGDGYRQGLIAFVKELKGEKEAVPFDEMAKSVYVISAILKSLETQKEANID